MPSIPWDAGPILADVGLPMLALHFPILILLLLPIILIEIAVARRRMIPPLPPNIVGGIAWANLWSTLLGIPLAWFGLFLLELAAELLFWAIHGDFSPDWSFPQRHKHIFDLILTIFTAPWLGPIDTDQTNYSWMPPAATLIMLVPYYFVSVSFEARIMRKYWPSREKSEVLMVSRRANAASYLLLAAAASGWLIIPCHIHGGPW